MIEVAVASLQETLRANGEAAPAGSLDPAREPLAAAVPPAGLEPAGPADPPTSGPVELER